MHPNLLLMKYVHGELLQRFHLQTIREKLGSIIKPSTTWPYGHSHSWHLHKRDDSGMCRSEFRCQLSHLLPSRKWNYSLNGKFVLRCHSQMHTIHKLPWVTVVWPYPTQDFIFWEEHIAPRFLEMLPILDTCHICIETYGLQCAISNRLRRLRNRRFTVLPSFYESIFT